MPKCLKRIACSRCGKTVNGPSPKKHTHCLHCDRWYHKKCFMAETGVITKEEKTTSNSCACCLSGTRESLLKRGLLHISTYTTDFLEHGFCIVPLFSSTLDQGRLLAELSSWNDDVVKYFKALLATYECQAELGGSVPTLEGGYSNFRQRGLGRFEIISDEITSRVVPLVSAAPIIQETLRDLLCNSEMHTGMKIMSSGCFLSLPGSETQNTHTDGPTLSDEVDLLPYAINVFVPLTAIDGRNGTQFFAGSQIIANEKTENSVCPPIALGNALLFDYRVLHRGLKNSKIDPRPCYYVTYAQSWYQDTYNFSPHRYKRRLEVSPTLLESREERMAKRCRS